MSALAIGAIVFACVFAGAVFGMVLGRVLPKEHLSADAKDVIKVTMAMIATLAALVLGLLTASAKSSLDEKENEVRGWAAQVVLLDRTLAQYGPETARRTRADQADPGRNGSLRSGPGIGEAVTFGSGRARQPASRACSSKLLDAYARRPMRSVGFNRRR